MIGVTLNQLLEAGVHFGHQTRKWNPKMKDFIYTARKGVHIIDLTETRKRLEEACNFLEKIASKGGRIVFVGTKRQASPIIKQEAERCHVFYLNERWIGGLLTNFENVKKMIKRLEKIEAEERNTEEWESLTVKQRYGLKREMQRLEKLIGGMRGLDVPPDVLFIVDVRRESTAVREANRTNIPVVALVDTNTDPLGIDYPIPGNDDSLRSISLIVREIADAILRGKKQQVEGRSEELAPSEREVPEGTFESLGLSKRIRNALEKAGIDNVEKLRALSEEEIIGIRGLGKKSVEELLKKLK